jgi:hypothetical protein
VHAPLNTIIFDLVTDARLAIVLLDSGQSSNQTNRNNAKADVDVDPYFYVAKSD